MMRFYPLLVSAAILIAALGIRAEEPDLVETVRNAVFDVYQRWRPREIKPVPIQVVDIDEASIEILGQWPWPRDVLADLVNHLNDAGAASIAFDMMFSEADRTSPNQMARQLQASPELKQMLDNLPDHDLLLADALARGRAVTGLALTKEEMESDRVQHYLDACDLVLAEDPAALENFWELSTAFPTDRLIQFHLERLETGHKGAMIHVDEK